jgi:hypothetical protein
MNRCGVVTDQGKERGNARKPIARNEELQSGHRELLRRTAPRYAVVIG